MDKLTITQFYGRLDKIFTEFKQLIYDAPYEEEPYCPDREDYDSDEEFAKALIENEGYQSSVDKYYGKYRPNFDSRIEILLKEAAHLNLNIDATDLKQVLTNFRAEGNSLPSSWC